MQKLVKIFLSAFVVCAVAACVPPEISQKKQDGSVHLDFRDKALQRLYDLRDRRQTDSLLRFFNHPEPTMRYLAALSFASTKDSTGIEALAALLADPSEEVRIAAAFSLGQIGKPRAEPFLSNAFRSDDSLSQYQRFNATILEAIGKCGGAASLKNLASISTYQNTDTALLDGQCRAVYRFALRGITDPAATQKMVEYVANERMPERVRLVAANYLARARDLSPDSAQAVLMAVGYVRALNPEVRMALAKALGKSKTRPAFGILSKVISTERDWRVKCNLINAFAKFEYDTVRSIVVPFIFDTNQHVSHTAAEFFLENGQAKDGSFYWKIARDNPNLYWESLIALYRASLRWLATSDDSETKDYLIFKLRDSYQKSGNNPYLRAACLRALGESGWQFRWVAEKGFQDIHPAVKIAACEVLNKTARKPNFYNYFGEGARGVRREIYALARQAVATGDPGMIAEASPAFESDVLKFKELEDSARLPDLKNALSKLKLPRDVEAYQVLEKTISYLEGTPVPLAQAPKFNHPIDWNRLATMPADGRVTLQTTAGKVVLRLFPEIAPGSVANFLALAKDGFFDGKNFHRVVPNFVVQGGCPRGDGYGAMDFSIRTEIGLLSYESEGWLGMASAGLDTEGTQFFITHSPALHLDGNYTIFGKVESGMDAVARIQQGTVIEKVVFEVK